MVQCRQCLSHNHASAGFCDQCGGPLLAAEASAAPPRRGRWWLLLVPLLILGVAIPVYRARDRGAARDDAGGPPVGGLPGATGEGRERPADELPTHLPGDPASPAADLALEVASSVSGIATGWLRIEDAWGGTLARVPAAATREGWLALPRIPCLGGKRWIFRHRRPGERLVTAGVWRRGEDLGLWRLARGERLDTPPLAPWEEGVEILQHPLSGTSPRPLAAPRGVQSHGLFLRFELPKGPPLPSVLVQGGSIVGWTFGGTLKGGWLWNGPPGDQVREEMGVEEFYQVTFAGGREEGFLEALAGMAKEAAESTLARLAEAFRLRPRLLPEETPNAIRLGEVARRLRALVKKIRDRGDPALVADLLYSDMLVELADGRLFLDWIEATAAADGEEHAIQRIDRSSAQIIPLGSDLERELLALLARLFRDAARRAREGGDLGRAWGLVEEGRRRFPDDVELTLLEVELLIDGGEWRPAESLLTRRSYPISHVDRIDRLKARISELKGEEGRIVIEFPPGASTIFTRARLNGSHDQRFLVDTGASLTTIPAATAAALGIRIDEHTPRRQVTTAGGFVMAPEVELASVELGGWVVERVQAFVVDLPGGDRRGGLGLLGMNFLSHFRVTLDNERGRLLLDPR